MSVSIDTLGRKYVSRRKTRCCVQCGTAYYKRGTATKYCSRACFYASRVGTFPNRKARARNGESLACSRCGAAFYRKASAIQDEENFCSRRCSNIMHLEQFSARAQARPSSLELLLFAELDLIGTAYQPQYPVSGFVADAYIPELNTVIEVDGEYWHSRPENVERDRRKDAALKAKGIKVVRISEQEARTDLAAALRRVGLCR